jgi:hypothetical protein
MLSPVISVQLLSKSPFVYFAAGGRVESILHCCVTISFISKCPQLTALLLWHPLNVKNKKTLCLVKVCVCNECVISAIHCEM